MKQIKIADTTLCRENKVFSFKEKVEIVRQLERLSVDFIEISEIENAKTDVLFIKTVASMIKKSTLSVVAGSSKESIENALVALSNAKNKRICIKLPVSPVGMEYICHKKGDKMLVWIEEAVKMAKQSCQDVEFCALDATRAEADFLKTAIETAVNSGATSITICDSAAEMLPDDFAAFVKNIIENVSVPVAVDCENKNGLAVAAAALSLKSGADCVKTSVGSAAISLETFVNLIRNCGVNYGVEISVRTTELNRIAKQIAWITNSNESKSTVSSQNAEDMGIHLDGNDVSEDVYAAVAKLGYDLSEDDKVRVYEEFLRVAEKKNVGAKELDAIVASVALQVPPTYKLVSYVVNNGNIISSSAQITLNKNGTDIQDVCIGDGPIDAAFLAIDKIVGHHYELDDFQIQSVTEGKEAVGSAVVKLRANGKVYSGNGISTDIIGASIRAYLNAVNKIVYEEI